MRELFVHVDVADLAAGTGEAGHRRRLVGLLDDHATLVVAKHVAGEGTAEPEIEFRLDDAVRLAERILSGDRRAMTTPGLARILSATAAMLFRVSHAAGAIQQTASGERDAGHDDDLGHQPEAGADEDPGD